MINSFNLVVCYDVEVASPPNFNNFFFQIWCHFYFCFCFNDSIMFPFFDYYYYYYYYYYYDYYFIIWKLFNDETLRNLFIVALWYKQLQLFSLEFLGDLSRNFLFFLFVAFYCTIFFLWFSQLFQNELDPVLYDSSCRFYKWVIKGHIGHFLTNRQTLNAEIHEMTWKRNWNAATLQHATCNMQHATWKKCNECWHNTPRLWSSKSQCSLRSFHLNFTVVDSKSAAAANLK